MKFLPRKLSSIFQLQLITAVYFPILVFSILIFFVVQQNLKQTVLTEILESSNHTSSLIETFLYKTVSSLRMVSKNTSICDKDIPLENKLHELNGLKEIHTIFHDIFILNKNKDIILSTNTKSKPVFEDKMLEEIKVADKPLITDVVYFDKNYVFFIIIPFFCNDNLLYLAGEINAKHIWNIINSVHYKKTGKVIMLNKEGFYIGGVNEDQLLTVFSPVEILNKIIPVKDCQSLEFQSQNGETYVAGISFAGVNNNFIVFPKWIVLQLQKVSESYFIIFLVKKYLFLIVLLMLFVIFIFSVYTSNLIIKPFNILIKGTEAASKGDLHFKTEIRSFEEISILSKNFDNMIEKLNAMHVKILDEMSEKENAQKQLLELNENLEKKVEERAFEIISLKEFYQNILNSINSGILFINRESKLEFINPTGEKLLNISFNRNKGKPVNEVSFPESFKNLLIEYLGNNTDFDSKEISFPINNTNIILGIKATFLSKESPILGSIIIFNDITERKKLQNEIIQTEKMFSCGLLSTGMAHDFNNVLNRIKISADISRKLSTNPELEEIFNEIKDGISEGQAMTRSLLSFAKNEEIELVPVDILSLLKSFEIKSKTLLNKNSVKLTINCNKRLVILAEPNHMMQIFLNLVQNAIQAIRDNGVITITANNVGNNCIINFSDNGPGISKVVLPHIFEPFYSTKVVSESSGWGLGLALVKSLAEKLKGNIEVTSTENHGTVFTLEFPIFNKITKEDL